MDLNKLKVFKCVAEFGKLNLASVHLKIASSAISVAISSLENEIGCSLFIRHYKGMKLTKHGEKLYFLSKKIFNDVDYFLRDLKDNKESVQGELILATSQGIASSNWFNNKIAILLEKYNELSVRIVNYRAGDVDSIVADIFLCPFIYNHSDLIQEKITDVIFRLFASRHYIEKFGLPKKLEDLDSHRLISFSHDLKNPFNDADSLLHIGREENNPRKVFLYVNNSIGLLKLVKMGLGIGSLHVNDILEHDLIPLFDKEIHTLQSTYLSYNKKLKNNKNVNAFKEIFLQQY